MLAEPVISGTADVSPAGDGDDAVRLWLVERTDSDDAP
jgi:hypothetical protein